MEQDTPSTSHPWCRPSLHAPHPHEYPSPCTRGSQQGDLKRRQPRGTAVHGEGLGHARPHGGAQPRPGALHLAGVHNILHRHPERAPCGVSVSRGTTRAWGKSVHGIRVSMGSTWPWDQHIHKVSMGMGSICPCGHCGHGESIAMRSTWPWVNVAMGQCGHGVNVFTGSTWPWGHQSHGHVTSTVMWSTWP